MRGVVVIAGCIVAQAGARPGHADFLAWKDGCPAYFPPEDVPAYTHDIKVHGGSASFGALPEIDSPLGQTRAAIEGWASTLHPEQGKALIEREAGLRLVLQGNLTSGPMFGLTYAGYDIDELPTGSDHQLGNLTLFVGYRHTGYLVGPLFRTGFAIRIAGGGPLTGINGAGIAAQREQVAINSPFRASSFGVESPVTGTLEYRIELVGCRGPFADLRADLSRWRVDEATDAVFDLPVELALGAYPQEGLAMYVAFGEELRSRVLQYERMTRVTLGVELQPSWVATPRLGVRASAITGHNVGGFEVGVTLSFLVADWLGGFE
jgi:hypothetical protein